MWLNYFWLLSTAFMLIKSRSGREREGVGERVGERAGSCLRIFCCISACSLTPLALLTPSQLATLFPGVIATRVSSLKCASFSLSFSSLSLARLLNAHLESFPILIYKSLTLYCAFDKHIFDILHKQHTLPYPATPRWVGIWVFVSVLRSLLIYLLTWENVGSTID